MDSHDLLIVINWRTNVLGKLALGVGALEACRPRSQFLSRYPLQSRP
jgi:hypothetical protein